MDHRGDWASADELFEAAMIRLERHGVSLFDLARTIAERAQDAARQALESGQALVLPTEVIRDQVCFEVLMAIDVTDRRLNEGLRLVGEATHGEGDLDLAERALYGRARELVGERNLVAVVDALMVILTSDDPDEAIKG